jgi:hypothetical protein
MRLGRSKKLVSPYPTNFANSFLFLSMGSSGSNNASNCKIKEMTTNPLPVFSLTTLILKSSDQNPAVPFTKSSITTLMNKNIPSNNDILAISLVWVLQEMPQFTILTTHAHAYRGNQKYQSTCTNQQGE